MKKQIILFSILGMLASTLGCGGGDGAGFEIPSITPPVTTVPEPEEERHPYDGSRLYLDFQLRWEGQKDTDFVTFDTCFLSIASPETNPATKNCTITVPEAKLYYSDINFKIGTDVAEYCPIVHFRPYYYRRSFNQNFIDPKSSVGQVVDCRAPGSYPDPVDPVNNPPTEVTDKLACYGGAGPNMEGLTEEGFLNGDRGFYFIGAVSKNSSYVLKASNTKRWYGLGRTNYMVINNPTDSNTPLDTGGVSLNDRAGGAGNWANYQITCETFAGTILHTINLTIGDENAEVGFPNDDYADWD